MNGSARRAAAAQRLGSAAGSPAALAALAAPLALTAAAVAARALPLDTATSMWSVRIWSAALCACWALGAWRAVRDRSAARALALAALGAAAAGLVWRWAAAAEGRLDAGVGEADAQWVAVRAGPLGKLPVMEVLELPASADGAARLRIDGREVAVPLGREVAPAPGVRLVVNGPLPAPAFELTAADAVLGPNGEQRLAGAIKVDPARRDFYMLGFLPHRFYVTVPRDARGGAPGALPPRLDLRVQRGKLRVFEGLIEPERPVSFEKLTFAYGEGTTWARIQTRRVPRVWPFALVSGVLAVAAGAAWSRARGRSA